MSLSKKDLKLGDKLRIVRSGHCVLKSHVGRIVTITNISPCMPWADWTDGVGRSGTIFFDGSGGPNTECYELIKENTMEKVTRNNLNNYTIYVTERSMSSYFEKGEEVRLIEDDETDSPKFKSLSTGTEAYYNIANLHVFGAIKELTLQEVADLAGVPVESLRIKE